MTEFNKKETITVANNGEDGIAAIYVHRSTGLVVGVSEDHCIFGNDWIEASSRGGMEILKHVWVEAWYTGETASYWVGDIDDLPQLQELLEETEVSSVQLVVSKDFIETALDVL